MQAIKIGVFENNDGIIPVLIPKNFFISEIYYRFDYSVDDPSQASLEFQDNPQKAYLFNLNILFTKSGFGQQDSESFHYQHGAAPEYQSVPAGISGQLYIEERVTGVNKLVPGGFYAYPSIDRSASETPWRPGEIHLIGEFV